MHGNIISTAILALQAKALRNELEKICTECKQSDCKFSTVNTPSFKKRIYVHKDNVVSNLHSHNYKQYI